MHFNPHYDLAGKHAFLSASKYHWINYDVEKLRGTYQRNLLAAKGTELHEIAAALIRNGLRMQRNKKTLNSYVNDAIGFRMDVEVLLYASPNAFGTADAIKFDEKTKFLRIHDLKTGEGKTSVHQLEIYAAFFCIEYGYIPQEITMEFRIYQNDEVQIYEGNPDDVANIILKIAEFDGEIEQLKAEAYS